MKYTQDELINMPFSDLAELALNELVHIYNHGNSFDVKHRINMSVWYRIVKHRDEKNEVTGRECVVCHAGAIMCNIADTPEPDYTNSVNKWLPEKYKDGLAWRLILIDHLRRGKTSYANTVLGKNFPIRYYSKTGIQEVVYALWHKYNRKLKKRIGPSSEIYSFQVLGDEVTPEYIEYWRALIRAIRRTERGTT